MIRTTTIYGGNDVMGHVGRNVQRGLRVRPTGEKSNSRPASHTVYCVTSPDGKSSTGLSWSEHDGASHHISIFVEGCLSNFARSVRSTVNQLHRHTNSKCAMAALLLPSTPGDMLLRTSAIGLRSHLRENRCGKVDTSADRFCVHTVDSTESHAKNVFGHKERFPCFCNSYVIFYRNCFKPTARMAITM